MKNSSVRKKQKTPKSLSNGNGKGAKESVDVVHSVTSDGESAQALLRVLTEVKNGNFKVRMPIDATGLNGKIYDTLNEIISLNENMMLEFTRAGNIIGKQGKLTQRIAIPGDKGSWNQGVNSLNVLISDLVHPTIEIAHVISSVAKGNLSQEMPEEIGDHKLEGEFLRIAKEVNYMVKQLNLFSMEVTRVAREVGSEGKLGGQAKVKGVGGVWKDLTDSVNHMAGNLTNQVRNIAEVTTAIARGNLSKKITVDVKGEMLELKNTINTMVDQMNSFGSEVTRVALEVGTVGKLGGQATVKGVGGVWKDLTDSVNQMAGNLTAQVRNIAGVTTAVAKGDLSKKITVDAKGELLELKNTINTMVDQLNSFTSEVTRVAREVGSEGQLGGQADVPGVGGTWKDLTDSVNRMAGNLTNQVRNIAGVTTLRAKVAVLVELYKKNRLLLEQERKLIVANKNLEREIEERKNSEENVKKLNHRLLENIAHLESANKDLESFAFMASHDLQEPLRKIRMFSDRLFSKYQNISEEDNRLIGRIQNAAERMQTLIIDILSFSKLTTDKSKFIISDLNIIVKELVQDMQEEIQEAGAEIHLDPMPSLYVNPSLMRPLFHNLINNALKYRKKDIETKIRIRHEISPGISVQDNSPVDKYCRILVEDNGIGFDPKYSEEIFRMFRRLHRNGEYSGTGVGLALCKKIAEIHNGHISARSKVLEGSTFIVSLPYRKTTFEEEYEPVFEL